MVENKAPIFIVGAPRSGTTLLQYMLRSHPSISVPTGESHFIVPLLKNSEKFGDLNKLTNIKKVLNAMYEQSQDFLDTDLHGIKFDIEVIAQQVQELGINSIEKIIELLFNLNALGEGKVRWGDKTPYYVLHMPFLKTYFPEAKFIHIVRDGRDCALSMFNRQKDFGIINIYHAAKYWQQYVETGSVEGKKLGAQDYMEVRYEDLLEKPEESLRKICTFLHEPFYDSLINFKKSSEKGKTPLLQSPIQKQNKNKWKKAMTARNIMLFEGAASLTLKEFGYNINNPTYKMPWLLRAYYRGLIILSNYKKKRLYRAR